MNQSLPFSGHLLSILRDYQSNGVSPMICATCPALCCSQGGFALLENVLRIYDRYRQGRLKREGYRFAPGFSFCEFIFEYFDVWAREIDDPTGKKHALLLFHMKTLGPEGHLVSIPDAGDYWEIREGLFELNPWMSRGCVFLSKPLPSWMEGDDGMTRHCILHTPQSATHLTEKPIDCVLHTCTSRLKSKRPNEKLMRKWFVELATAFPNSVRRFQKLQGK
ncbi:MAG: hypothetical protein A2293_10060 [Elusimicrobia bacterium RIFOXYB2_FULL_49_7]|nr:MAG: hypothetical protein A2293_10060 [Elusimicrobia bacterium RIFOXYB2_FULL_49_7]